MDDSKDTELIQMRIRELCALQNELTEIASTATGWELGDAYQQVQENIDELISKEEERLQADVVVIVKHIGRRAAENEYRIRFSR